MKFIAKKDAISIQSGVIYEGQIVALNSGREGEASKIRIVVFNDNNHWRAYSPSVFYPYDPKEDLTLR
jgi:hypothetical protein